MALGLTSRDRTQNGSRMQTNAVNRNVARGDWEQMESMEHIAKPDPKIWATIERVDSEEDGPSEPIPPGMKKTTWNVRRPGM